MTTPIIKPCPACGEAPVWSWDKPGHLIFACRCGGLGVDVPKGCPKVVLESLKAEMENNWNESVGDAKLYFAKGAHHA